MLSDTTALLRAVGPVAVLLFVRLLAVVPAAVAAPAAAAAAPVAALVPAQAVARAAAPAVARSAALAVAPRITQLELSLAQALHMLVPAEVWNRHVGTPGCPMASQLRVKEDERSD
jgi:hypothetical protein